MNSPFLNSVRNKVKNWWISLVIGILAIILGVWCIATPDSTLMALSYLFIIAFLVSGVFEIIFAVSNRNIFIGWGWSLASGICELLLGVLLLILPLPLITGMLVFLVGFWILFRSLWTIGEACLLQRMEVKGWGWLLALGILCVLFSFFFLASPLFSAMFIVIFVGIALIFYGIFRVYHGIGLRNLYKDIKDIDKDVM